MLFWRIRGPRAQTREANRYPHRQTLLGHSNFSCYNCAMQKTLVPLSLLTVFFPHPSRQPEIFLMSLSLEIHLPMHWSARFLTIAFIVFLWGIVNTLRASATEVQGLKTMFPTGSSLFRHGPIWGIVALIQRTLECVATAPNIGPPPSIGPPPQVNGYPQTIIVLLPRLESPMSFVCRSFAR